MNNVIVKQASDYKFTEFFSSFQNFVSPTLFNESWYIEMKKINTNIKKNNLDDKFDFSDKRLVLIAYKSMEIIQTSGNEKEWFVVRSYFDFYSSKKDGYYNDIKEFIDMYIGYTYSGAVKDEKAEKKETKLKQSLSSYIDSGELSLPLFVKEEIVGKVVMATKPEIEFAPEPPQDVPAPFDQDVAQKEIENQYMFAEMMLEDATKRNSPAEIEEWGKLMQFLELLSNKKLKTK